MAVHVEIFIIIFLVCVQYAPILKFKKIIAYYRHNLSLCFSWLPRLTDAYYISAITERCHRR